MAIPLHKGKGLFSFQDNYRPISLLSPIAKIFEVVLFHKLGHLIEPKLCPQQHGFRKHHSTHTALSLFSQEVWSALDQPEGRVCAVFIDLKKAICSVQSEISLHKLIFRFGLPKGLVKVVRNFLSFRSFTIKIGTFFSKLYPEVNSVPQGSTLGPLLFSAFIDNISDCIDLPSLIYADDLVIYTHGPHLLISRLNSTLKRVHDWSVLNGIEINIEKNRVHGFSQKRIPPYFPQSKHQQL